MPEEGTDRKRRFIGYALNSLLLLAVVFAIVFNTVGDKGSGKGAQDTAGDINERNVLLGIGSLMFWLICLCIVLIGAFKFMELDSKY